MTVGGGLVPACQRDIRIWNEASREQVRGGEGLGETGQEEKESHSYKGVSRGGRLHFPLRGNQGSAGTSEVI